MVYPKSLAAEQVVERLDERFASYFHDRSWHAKLDDGILSDAAAGADYIKIRRGVSSPSASSTCSKFTKAGCTSAPAPTAAATRRHVAGQRSALHHGHSGRAGRADEVITFTATPARSKKLNNRILACDKAEDGADFLDMCEFYRTEGTARKSVTQLPQRVFRGGVISGGAPFTKDISYCKGFIMIYNFLRTAIRFGRPELIPFLFAGKVTLEDVPVLYRKFREGVVDAPHYLPPQFRDLNGLAMWMAYSNFFNRVNLESIQDHYRSQFAT